MICGVNLLMLKQIFIATFLFCILLGCNKESFIFNSSARIAVSTDTLSFDTVFNSVGSVTAQILVYNENDQRLRLSSIRLMGGEASPFTINADGEPGPEIHNIEIAGRDSIYLFVSVKIDPTTATLPFLVRDSIRINFNGNEKLIQLRAYGQNARFFNSRIIRATERWSNELPIVIYGGLLIAEGAELQIEEGTKIFVHADAPIIVDGTLTASGKRYDSTRIIFSGDRLDKPYSDYPAAWPGIIFRNSSINNRLEYTTIKNAYQGLVVEGASQNSNPKLQIRQSIIENCYESGLLALGSHVEAENSLFSNSGKNIILAYGGNYRFRHCTVVAYSNTMILHREPVLLVTDFVREDGQLKTASLDALFQNSIFWGDGGTVDDEVVAAREGQSAFNLRFEHSVWKIKNPPANSTIVNMISSDPLFDSINTFRNYYNFRLKPESPARKQGLPTAVSIDLEGNTRDAARPDIGAYEQD